MQFYIQTNLASLSVLFHFPYSAESSSIPLRLRIPPREDLNPHMIVAECSWTHTSQNDTAVAITPLFVYGKKRGRREF
ncbi:hypothetical protein VTK56DRAFT_3455 [Thermocarpiscus australiensis]